ncbi:DUF3618 domain-containing protein [Pimelobacter simplex]|uniref:DUF3618 domain-containing protein n=1 Tax=Nocardioides simplex TaxID=2045 RepID=UPI001933546F|nr:DUF3618 domain-containing protein [Pimelobacter simplex]
MTAEIAGTRRELTRDVDELYDKVAPSRVIERRKASMRGRVTSMKERVMGTAERGAHSAATTGHSAVSAVSAVSDTATGAVHAVESRTQGAPLAAGLIAFGAGMVVSALVPASEAETQAARRLTEAAEDHGLVDEAKAVGQQVGDSLKESAAGAADELKASVQDSARTLQEEGRTSAGHVRDDAPGT